MVGVPGLARGVTHSDLSGEAEGRDSRWGARSRRTGAQSRAREIVALEKDRNQTPLSRWGIGECLAGAPA